MASAAAAKKLNLARDGIRIDPESNFEFTGDFRIYEQLKTARFEGAMIFWTSPSDFPQKMTPQCVIFRSIRPLAQG